MRHVLRACFITTGATHFIIDAFSPHQIFFYWNSSLFSICTLHFLTYIRRHMPHHFIINFTVRFLLIYMMCVYICIEIMSLRFIIYAFYHRHTGLKKGFLHFIFSIFFIVTDIKPVITYEPLVASSI